MVMKPPGYLFILVPSPVHGDFCIAERDFGRLFKVSRYVSLYLAETPAYSCCYADDDVVTHRWHVLEDMMEPLSGPW